MSSNFAFTIHLVYSLIEGPHPYLTSLYQCSELYRHAAKQIFQEKLAVDLYLKNNT